MRKSLSAAILLACSVALAQTSPPPAPAPKPDPNIGFLPLGPNGTPLNLDFEKGDLTDWTSEGDAFDKQPVKGDTVKPRRSDMTSNHQGDFWIGGFEKGTTDKPTGLLTSAPFEVTHNYASFLVGGGPNEQTRVEIVRADTKQVIFKTTGFEAEDMARVVVDLQLHLGKQIFIRLIDEHTGHWGHINFDDFRFHVNKPTFKQPAKVAPPPLDIVGNAGLTAQEATKAMTMPKGFSATVFASEPDVNQPVGFAMDAKGRLWVAEAWGYPKRQPEGQGKDRILIFEDTDGDGKHDKRTVFIEGLNLVSGIEVGFGGVFVGAAPNLLFIPDKNADDKPDGAPEILLDGWHYEDTHETLNSFIWGPDGWLYGCHGVFTHSRVGKPGTPDDQRTPINAGIWRWHPTKKQFEVFAQGTSNPWGVDFDDYGQAFAEACVIPHLFHVIQGARYQRQAGQHFNQYTYKDIQTIADHVHYAGSGGPHAGNNRSDAAGGGHAHCGMMVYLGGAWPAEYRNTLFMGNVHGNRFNTDLLERKGSGYVGKHGPDFLKTNDKWARLINLKYGPDGNVYFLDWYDKQACHRNEPEIWDRTNGRIYKVSYEGSKSVQADLTKLSDSELVQLQLHDNDWYVRNARRLLQERAATGNDKNVIQQSLANLLNTTNDPRKRLRVLWALHATGNLNEPTLLKELKNENEYVRAWAIQLATETASPSQEMLSEYVRLAVEDPSAVVRLYLACAAQRIPVDQRWDILKGLLAHPQDAADHNLPLMVWYALEPAVAKDPTRALALARSTKLPNIVQFTARRVASAK